MDIRNALPYADVTDIRKPCYSSGSVYSIEYVQDAGGVVQSVGTAVDQGIPLQIDTRNFFFECK